VNGARWIIVLVAWGGLAASVLAQEPRNQGVKSTATVEVLDDATHVDDVISQMKKQAPAPTDLSPTTPDTRAAAQTLKSERPDLTTELADQDKHGKSSGAEKHLSWRQQRALEERLERLRKNRNP
jgi:hypothetical protein